MSHKWPTVRLAEVLRPVSRPTTPDVSHSYRLLGVRLDGNGAFHRETVTGAETAASQLFEVTDGDFIYSRLFAWRGAFGLIGRDLAGAYVSSEFPTFRADEQRLDSRFLNYWFRLPDTLRRVEADCTGSTPLTRNRFKETFFLNLEIALPSIGEQRRIVDLIEAIAEKVAEARRLRGGAEAAAEALVNAILRRTAARLGEEYRPVPLGQLLTCASYGTSERCTSERRVNHVPVLRIPNVASEKLCLDDLKYAALTDNQLAKTSLETGDILIVRTNGSLGLVGRSAVVADLSEQTSFASYLIRLRFDSTQLRPEFAQRMLRYLRIDGQLVDLARTTAGQYNVSLGRLKGAAVPVPPLAIQDQVVAELDRCQSSVYSALSVQRGTNQSIEYLLPAVLDTAFRGGA